jgi:uncharacterized FAD-dependent dehydrogenase
MNLIISAISLPWEAPEKAVIQEAFRLCQLPETAGQGFIYKKSIDARRGRVKAVYSVQISCPDGTPYPDSPRIRLRNSAYLPEVTGQMQMKHRPVIAGLGPAGLFAGYFLAKNGYAPIILERGKCVEERDLDVARFLQEGVLNPESNLQFGEGGAGTYSDGKLTTRIHDPACETVLDLLVRFGAPSEVKFLAKPHIGTDILKNVVQNIRKEIVRLGGEVRFKTTLTGVKQRTGSLTGVQTTNGEIPCEALVLAVGHSARDTFRHLWEQEIFMRSKAFSVGVRVEHWQEDINRGLYGKMADRYDLPPGEYALSHRQGERAVYTFCMCPGGYVVPAQSEENTVVTNGMSYHARSGDNANSAVVVSVGPSDFPNVFDGLDFQRQMERKAYAMTGGYRAPSQTVGSFLQQQGRSGKKVNPTYALGIEDADLHDLFPEIISSMLEDGLRIFGRKIKGFDQSGARLTGPETRTSSPVRIQRGEDFHSISLHGLIPCGEGAGYAGGIISAAVDGIRAAEKIMSAYRPF